MGWDGIGGGMRSVPVSGRGPWPSAPAPPGTLSSGGPGKKEEGGGGGGDKEREEGH